MSYTMNIRKLQRQIGEKKRAEAGLDPRPNGKPIEVRYARPSGTKRIKTLHPTKGWHDSRDMAQ